MKTAGSMFFQVPAFRNRPTGNKFFSAVQYTGNPVFFDNPPPVLHRYRVNGFLQNHQNQIAHAADLSEKSLLTNPAPAVLR